MVERSRAFGRLLCEGVILYAQEQRWTIRYLTPDMLQRRQTADLDGFIARVTTPEIARTLVRTGKPVVDVFYNYPDFGFAIVKEKHETLGRIAAEHFLDRKFVNFAYCPYGIGKTSSYCQAAFTHRLRREGRDCHVFTGASETAYEPDNRTIIGERLARPRDAKRTKAAVVDPRSIRTPFAVLPIRARRNCAAGVMGGRDRRGSLRTGRCRSTCF